MSVIFELDEYVVLRDFSYKTAIFPNKNPSQKMMIFRKGQKIGGFPTDENIQIDVGDGYKVYLPYKYNDNLLKRTENKIKPKRSTPENGDKYSNMTGLNDWFRQ